MTATYGEYPFFPLRLVSQLDICETDKLEYWEEIAKQAVEYFEHKEDFMDWVCRNFWLEENRTVADGAWDLVRYINENPEMDCE